MSDTACLMVMCNLLLAMLAVMAGAWGYVVIHVVLAAAVVALGVLAHRREGRA